jgi:hypothetical protein
VADANGWAGTQNSAQITAKGDGAFISTTDKATQLKALKDSLALCSKPMQLHVRKKLIQKTKKSISVADLVKLSDVVGLGAATAQALDHVLAIGGGTFRALDRVLGRGGC